MEKEELFDSDRQRFGYGLVRLNEELKIVDKNKKAALAHIFPKKGASIVKITLDRGKRLQGLSLKEGDNTAFSLSDGIKTVNVLALRERSGSIMLLMHPILSSVSLGRNEKVSIAYGVNILKIIYGERIERSLSVKEIFPFSDLSVKRLSLVSTALDKIAERLGKISSKIHLMYILN